MASATGAGGRDEPVVLQLAYLRSYSGMGRAMVSCLQGCKCPATMLDGHHSDRVSLTHLHMFKVSQAEECMIEVVVLDETASSTSGHKVKVKVSSLVVAERSGDGEQLRNTAAVEAAGSAAALSADGTGMLEHAHGRPSV
jgi:hypothetical protein